MNPKIKRAKKEVIAFALRDLTVALEAARDHLEYCGYGDSWERECARDSGLSKQIEDAILKGKMTILSL